MCAVWVWVLNVVCWIFVSSSHTEPQTNIKMLMCFRLIRSSITNFMKWKTRQLLCVTSPTDCNTYVLCVCDEPVDNFICRVQVRRTTGWPNRSTGTLASLLLFTSRLLHQTFWYRILLWIWSYLELPVVLFLEPVQNNEIGRFYSYSTHTCTCWFTLSL